MFWVPRTTSFAYVEQILQKGLLVTHFIPEHICTVLDLCFKLCTVHYLSCHVNFSCHVIRLFTTEVLIFETVPPSY